MVNLRETQRTSKLNINSKRINVNDFVLDYDEDVLRHFWRIAIVTGMLPSRGSEIVGAIVRITNTTTILKCPQINSSHLKILIMTRIKQLREQKGRREASVISELKRKYEC